MNDLIFAHVALAFVTYGLAEANAWYQDIDLSGRRWAAIVIAAFPILNVILVGCIAFEVFKTAREK